MIYTNTLLPVEKSTLSAILGTILFILEISDTDTISAVSGLNYSVSSTRNSTDVLGEESFGTSTISAIGLNYSVSSTAHLTDVLGTIKSTA